jgi:hypothetical protein
MDNIASALMASAERAPWGWGLFLSVTYALIKGWPAIADATLKAKMALGDRRTSRIEKLENKIDQQRVSYEAEIGVLRHGLNNVTACLDALLLLIEAAPEAAREHAAKVRKMMADQAATQKREKEVILAARIIGANAEAIDPPATGAPTP